MLWCCHYLFLSLYVFLSSELVCWVYALECKVSASIKVCMWYIAETFPAFVNQISEIFREVVSFQHCLQYFISSFTWVQKHTFTSAFAFWCAAVFFDSFYFSDFYTKNHLLFKQERHKLEPKNSIYIIN